MVLLLMSGPFRLAMDVPPRQRREDPWDALKEAHLFPPSMMSYAPNRGGPGTLLDDNCEPRLGEYVEVPRHNSLCVSIVGAHKSPSCLIAEHRPSLSSHGQAAYGLSTVERKVPVVRQWVRS